MSKMKRERCVGLLRQASDGSLSEEERQVSATIKEIREGILGFVPSVMRHLNLPGGQGSEVETQL